MNSDLIQVDPLWLQKWDRPVPRYTSYPTAPQFHSIEPEQYLEKLNSFDSTQKPLSLYIHIPFCQSMCLFCACSVILNRQPERQEIYFQHLLLEMKQLAAHFSQKRSVTQFHMGGGTPTSLTIDQFEKLMETVQEHFEFLPNAEISIEIDPRTVYADGGHKLSALKRLGFNRVSFGVQDLDPKVQEAVRRRQSEEITVSTYLKAREIGFDGINIDLIYGLPFQTTQSFAKTANRLIELKPDRIAFYSYAKVPWIKEHQKAIRDEDLPSTEEKFKIYVEARARFMEGGYQAIGMDHFALKEDPMSIAYLEKKLTRNFQGYSMQLAEDMIAFGVTSIGFLENGYFQNLKGLEEYQRTVGSGKIPIHRGYILSEEDILRREAIQSVMCNFEVDKKRYGHLAHLEPFKTEGLLEEKGEKWEATPLGRLFIRIIASSFDSYIEKGRFSQSV